MRFDRHGIVVEVAAGWEAASFRREELSTAQLRSADESSRSSVAPEATTHPVVHIASFPLPPDRGDYGSGAVDLMGAADVFVSLLEFHPDAARTALFARRGVPSPLALDDFSPTSLQRMNVAQSGCQRFFNASGRAFCLYVVLGSHTRRHLLVPPVNSVLSTLEIRE